MGRMQLHSAIGDLGQALHWDEYCVEALLLRSQVTKPCLIQAAASLCLVQQPCKLYITPCTFVAST